MEIFIQYVLASTFVSAVTLFIIKTLWEQRAATKRSDASRELLVRYAKKAIEHIKESQKTVKDDDVTKKIEQGNPYGESEKNYTPYILFSEEDKLSFAQVREIFQYVTEKKQEPLFEYFIAQAKLDAIVHSINSDIVRSIPQQQKVAFWKIYVEYRDELLKKATQFTEEGE